ncbi:MAG: DUF2231 domain-containing protein [Syntrophorhabdales bacterium]|jgi:predicted heme/steroid binding protein/uncharacterized membrane protein
MGKEFDPRTLAAFDGKDGRPVYIAAGGRVVDVSASPLWKTGRHMARHDAGRDLTAELAAAPHGPEVLDRYPEAGRLTEAIQPAPALPSLVSTALARYPLLRRHPHPATVHFPIVFSLSAAFFSLLYAMTGNRPFEACAFYCLIGAFVFMPLAIGTGLATWWINYMAKPMRPVTIKRNLSLASALGLGAACAWGACEPGLLDTMSGKGVIYLSLVIALALAVLVVAYYGGTLTFPVEKK